MFEREAKERARKLEENQTVCVYEEGFKDGAEFGYNKANERLTKAKELLTKWVELFNPKVGNIPKTPIQVETERFLIGGKK